MALNDSSELLDVIKSRGSVPVNAGSWTSAALLRTASEVVNTWHLPMLVEAKGEYLVKETQIPLVQGQREYLISYRAAAVRLLSRLAAGSIENPLEDLNVRAQSLMQVDRTRQGPPVFYSFREGYVQLFPLPASASEYLKVLWHFRPNRLTVTTDCAQISTITPANPDATHTLLTFLTVFTSAMAGPTGTKYDFIGYRNPFTLKAIDVPTATLVSAGGSTISVLTSDIPADLAAGDWVAAAGYTPFPNIPAELHTPVALRTAAIATGSRQSALRDALNAEASAIEKNLLNGILSPRSKGNPKRLVQRRWMRHV